MNRTLQGSGGTTSGWVIEPEVGMLAATIPLGLVAITIFVDAVLMPAAFLGHWFDASRPDFFLMADSFLHGHLWLDVDWRPPINDLILFNGHVYVPFQPFPAFLFMPLVALTGVTRAIAIEPLVNATLTGVDVALAWVLLGRLGVRRIEPRMWLTMFLGFGTVLWNITVRGGVWHTAEIIAIGLTFLALIETRSSEPRGWLMGLLGGAAFLTRSPLLFALPYYAWVAAGRPTDLDGIRWAVSARARDVLLLVAATVPFFLCFAWYNWARFGSPLETGYALASLPAFLEEQRAKGLFSIVHLPMNVEYLFLKGPDQVYPHPPFFEPSTLGMSVVLTSPALFVGLRSLVGWGERTLAAAGPLMRVGEARIVALTGLLVLTPTMLYYGGGWVQFGFRYLLDSMPFWFVLCGAWAARRGVGLVWQLAITWSIVVNMVLVYWALNV